MGKALGCSCNWPEGFVFFLEKTKERVEMCREGQRSSTFHCALMMEYCPFGGLDAFIRRHMRRGLSDRDRHGSLQWFRLCQRFAAEILLAMEFLHSNAIVYRDLKPENVLLVPDQDDRSPHVKLGDFGFSKAVTQEEPSKSLAGSPYFSAPEMYEIGRTRVPMVTDSAVDVFSLGLLLFVMWYGCDLWKKGCKEAQPVDSWSRDERDTNFRWLMTSERSLYPTPELLLELASMDRCPPVVCQIIGRCARSRSSDRATVQQILDSSLFLQIDVAGETLPKLNFDSMLRT